MSKLFESLKLGAISTPNRIFQAPCTRARATKDHIPTPLMIEYYRQRASAGLIITEATGVSQQGLGWPFAPGIWSDAQVEAWKPVTQAVHKAGGRIIVQLWHMGRLVHPSFNKGASPVSASDIRAFDYSDGVENPFRLAHTYEGKQQYTVPHAATKDEIKAIVQDFRKAARNALLAGFDGVQVHGANGYLIDQFLRDGSNKRTDEYGGSIENRIRLLTEVTKAIIEEIGADRTAVRLSPNGEAQGTNDSKPGELFPAAAKALSDLGIGSLELKGLIAGFEAPSGEDQFPHIRKVFKGPLILNADFDLKKAEEAINSGAADAISFGRLYFTNPDLVERFKVGAPINKDTNMQTWYSQGVEGYTDYPAHQ